MHEQRPGPGARGRGVVGYGLGLGSGPWGRGLWARAARRTRGPVLEEVDDAEVDALHRPALRSDHVAVTCCVPTNARTRSDQTNGVTIPSASPHALKRHHTGCVRRGSHNRETSYTTPERHVLGAGVKVKWVNSQGYLVDEVDDGEVAAERVHRLEHVRIRVLRLHTQSHGCTRGCTRGPAVTHAVAHAVTWPQRHASAAQGPSRGRAVA